MALREAQPEPSMEEILASIRRIISEDGPAEEPTSPEAAASMTAAAEPVALDDDLLVFEDFAAAPHPVDPPEPDYEPAASARETPAPVRGQHGLISDPAAAAAAGAFTRLAGTIRLSDAPGQTLEGVITELLRPMLKEWLDANLARIVEAKVEAELDRIARLAR